MITRAFGLKLGRFGLVGLISTLVYVVAATILVHWTALPTLLINAVAFVASGAWGYLGHYYVTFRSDASHRTSFVKFFVLAAIGYAFSNGVILLDQHFGVSPDLGTGFIAVTMPVLNFVLMQLWVFASGRAAPAGASADHPDP